MEQARRAALCPSEHADVVSYDWGRIGVGIVFAGAAYPILLAMFIAIAVVGWSILNLAPNSAMEDGVNFVFGLAAYSLVAAMIGVLWSGFVAVLTLPVIYSVAKTLSLRTSIVRLGAFSGGLVGFICTLPLSLELPWSTFPSDIWQFILATTVGPGLATVLGQLGGAWGGNRSRQAGQDVNKQLLRAMTSRTAGEPSPDAAAALDDEDGRPFQFGIRHLLWVSVWLSLLLALIRLCGIPYQLMLPLLLGWAAFQTASIWIGERLVSRIVAWRKRHASGDSSHG